MNSEFGIIFAPQIAVNHRVGFHIRRCKIYIWAHFSVGDGLPVPNRAGDFSVHIFRYGLPHNKTTLFHRLKAIEKIGRSATDGKADIKQMTDALDTVDDGQAIKNLIQIFQVLFDRNDRI